MNEVLDNDDLRLHICLRLGSAEHCCAAAAVSSRFRETCGCDAVWEPLCGRRWSTKARRFHLAPERRAKLLSTGLSWREQYRLHEADGQGDEPGAAPGGAARRTAGRPEEQRTGRAHPGEQPRAKGPATARGAAKARGP